MTKRNLSRRLDEALKELKLPTVRGEYEDVAVHARQESLSYEEFLLELTERERDVRRQHRIERGARASKLPLEKTLKSFDRKRLPRKVDSSSNWAATTPSSSTTSDTSSTLARKWRSCLRSWPTATNAGAS